ncbi:MAG: hypothetical protein BGO11_05720 [Solirubrobacterales bacterium 70-9]|nr:MAG: hypothetical protein BGO11_05720 [Solirubrobacterales bacterium 70-9]
MRRPTSRRPATLLALLALAALGAALLSGCGGSDVETRAAPPSKDFPSAHGKTISQLLHGSGATPSEFVIAPASEVFDTGVERYPFGVFTAGQEQVEDVEVALYFAKDGKSKVLGPLPAKLESLETKPAYRSQNGSGPGEAKSVYVVPKVDFDKNGPWLAIAMIKNADGKLEASRIPSPVIGKFPKVPKVGERPPKIETLTAADVGNDLEKIDTRVPPDQMHKVNFAEVLGKKPIVLVFATPALCQSRVCGPVVDVAQQVADKYEPRADFIHQEVYVDNEISKGIRPQLKAFGLPTEPWTYLIDKEGVIKDRLSGAYGVDELEQAMQSILPG